MDLDDKQQFYQWCNQLTVDYLKTIEPVSWFKIYFTSPNSGNLSVTNSSSSSSNASSAALPIVGQIFNDKIKDFPSLRKKSQIQPAFFFGIAFDYRIK